MVVKTVAVVGREDDDRVVEHPATVQRFDDGAHLVVDIGDVRHVVLALARQLFLGGVLQVHDSAVVDL
ncbi:hypothetical protein GCM10027271_47200 [Saccharopolyspora gloriosae]